MKKLFNLLFFIPLLAIGSLHARVEWTALMLERYLLTWQIIILMLLLEFIVIWWFTRLGPKRSAILALVLNSVSTLAGIVFIPACGLLPEIMVQPFHSAINMPWKIALDIIRDTMLWFTAAGVSASIELAMFQIMITFTHWPYQRSKKYTFFWLFGAHLIPPAIYLFGMWFWFLRMQLG